MRSKARLRNMVFVGNVQKGAGQAGAQFGVPTANLDVNVLPEAVKPGVYAAKISCDGITHQAVVFIGRAHLLPEKPWRVEAHLLGFSGNLLGRTLTVELIKLLREPIVFQSAQEAQEIIHKDIATTQTFFSQ